MEYGGSAFHTETIGRKRNGLVYLRSRKVRMDLNMVVPSGGHGQGGRERREFVGWFISTKLNRILRTGGKCCNMFKSIIAWEAVVCNLVAQCCPACAKL